jgi:transcriptional regulator with XRE-family HTH domain
MNEEQLTLNRKEELLRALSDLEYRQGFVEGHAKDTIAFQLRQLRKAAGWEQREVAERLGNPNLQPMISRYENPDYGRYSISTLLELASVFDVALVVRFAPFSQLLEWDWDSDATTLCPASYPRDERIIEIASEIQREQQRIADAQAHLLPAVTVLGNSGHNKQTNQAAQPGSQLGSAWPGRSALKQAMGAA